MEDRKDILDAANEQVAAARDVDALFNSKGWILYRQFLRSKIQALKEKDDYTSLHQLNADRKLIKTLMGLEDELKDVLSSAETASTIINKLDNNQTSDDSIPLDTFETESQS